MAFCSNCGTAVGEGVRFCPKCGREVGGSAGAAAPASASGGGATGGATAGGATTGGATTAGGLTSNVAGLLCYVPFVGFIVSIVFLLLEPYNRDPFVRFHALQSIFFAVATFVLSIVVAMIPFVGWMISPFLWLGYMALWVVLMVQAYQNKKWKLPVIGDIAEKQG